MEFKYLKTPTANENIDETLRSNRSTDRDKSIIDSESNNPIPTKKKKINRQEVKFSNSFAVNTENINKLKVKKTTVINGGKMGEFIEGTNNKNKPKYSNKVACVRCRRRHLSCVKSSDSIDPTTTTSCLNCSKSGVACEYVEPEKKLNISMKYLQQLQNDIADLKRENNQLKSVMSQSNNTNNNNNNNNGIRNENSTETHLFSRKIDFNNSKQTKNGAHDETQDNDVYGIRTQENPDELNALDENEEKVSNFAERRGRLVGSRTGQKYFVGSSSMTLFGMEIQSLVEKFKERNSNNSHNKRKRKRETSDNDNNDNIDSLEYPDLLSSNTFQNSEPGIDKVLEEEGNAYKIVLAESNTNSGVLSVNFTLPAFSYAMLLVDTFITYNDGCFYFFNEGIVKENLKQTYNGYNVYENDQTLQTIWFCKCLLIFAIGEMYLGTVKDNDGLKLSTTKRKVHSRLPGSGFFEQASELFGCLFSSSRIDNLTKEGAIEVLLLYAFYLQVADCTVASYFYFGQTLRACLILGWHVDAEKDILSRFELEHRRRLWWTVYMFERMLSSKAGLPLSFMDNTISSELPKDFDMSKPPRDCEFFIFPESEYITSCIKITQVNAQILNKLYDRQPDTNILPILTQIVQKLLVWRSQLPVFLQVEFNKTPFDISRLCTNIFTEYFQGLNLAIRPLLYHFSALILRKRGELKNSSTSKPLFINLQRYSKTISNLLNCSLQASINTVKSLWVMFEQNNIALFGYMDREYLFTASCTLVLFSVTFGLHSQINLFIDQSLRIFTKMRNLGNNPAGLRRKQLLKLMHDLDVYGFMGTLIKKHFDNLKIDANFEDNYGPEIKIVSVPTTESEKQPLQTNLTHIKAPSISQPLPSSNILQHHANVSSLRSTSLNNNPMQRAVSETVSNTTDSSENIIQKNANTLMNHVMEDTDEVEKFFQSLDDWSVQDNQLWKDISDQAMWLGSN